MVRVWMHNGMVNMGSQKMSKSLGKFATISALLESSISAMNLRLFVLQATTANPLISPRRPLRLPPPAGGD